MLFFSWGEIVEVPEHMVSLPLTMGWYINLSFCSSTNDCKYNCALKKYQTMRDMVNMVLWGITDEGADILLALSLR